MAFQQPKGQPRGRKMVDNNTTGWEVLQGHVHRGEPGWLTTGQLVVQ